MSCDNFVAFGEQGAAHKQSLLCFVRHRGSLEEAQAQSRAQGSSLPVPLPPTSTPARAATPGNRKGGGQENPSGGNARCPGPWPEFTPAHGRHPGPRLGSAAHSDRAVPGAGVARARHVSAPAGLTDTGSPPLLHTVPAAFAGLMYLFVRQKYFVGYLGERTQR